MTAALKFVDARRSYGDIDALAGVSLAVSPGEIHAIVGLNGAGKTTLMKSALGHTRLDGGEVRLFGSASPQPDHHRRLGYVVDHPFGYPELTVRANIAYAARLHRLPPAQALSAADEWIDRLALGRWALRRARGLSLGNRQRLGLACAVAHAPDLLILDEPTNALDPAGVLLLRDVLLEASARGAGVLVSSHHLDEVARIADSITVIHAGHVVGTLAPGQTDIERHFFAMVRDWDAARAANDEDLA